MIKKLLKLILITVFVIMAKDMYAQGGCMYTDGTYLVCRGSTEVYCYPSPGDDFSVKFTVSSGGYTYNTGDPLGAYPDNGDPIFRVSHDGLNASKYEVRIKFHKEALVSVEVCSQPKNSEARVDPPGGTGCDVGWSLTADVYPDSAPPWSRSITGDDLLIRGQNCDLTLNTSSWPEKVVESYQWSANGRRVAGSTGSINTGPLYKTTTFEVDFTGYCMVIPSTSHTVYVINQDDPFGGISASSTCLSYNETATLTAATEEGAPNFSSITWARKHSLDAGYTTIADATSASLDITNDGVNPGQYYYRAGVTFEGFEGVVYYYATVYFDNKIGLEVGYTQLSSSCYQFRPIVTNQWCAISGYSWQVDGAVVSTEESPMLDLSEASGEEGEIAIALTASFACDCKSTTMSHSTTVPAISNGLAIDFTAESSFCTYLFTPDISYTDPACFTRSISWDFGDGEGTALWQPVHKYTEEATHTVVMTVVHNCGCSDWTSQVSKEVAYSEDIPNIPDIPSPVYSTVGSVLSASAQTFTNNWFASSASEQEAIWQSEGRGLSGPWRNLATYVYEADRLASEQVLVSTDGTFNLNTFNWNQGVEGAVPNWLLAQEVTDYDAYSHETENVDVLGRYSSAIYGYDQQLVTAVVQNSAKGAVAYTGFEDLPETGQNTLYGGWNLTDGSAGRYERYPIKKGRHNFAAVDVTEQELYGVDRVTIWVKRGFGQFFLGQAGFGSHMPYVQNVRILCIGEGGVGNGPQTLLEEGAPLEATTLLAFDEVVHDGAPYNGHMVVYRAGTASSSFSLSEEVSHTGSVSLKLPAGSRQVLNQNTISVSAGETYLVSFWASAGGNTNGANLAYGLPSGFQPTLQLFNKSSEGSRHLGGPMNVRPVGPLIEGWQQLVGYLAVPHELDDEVTNWQLIFPSVATAMYIDDLRVHPVDAQMRSFVYDAGNHRLQAVLDENNYASYYYYDAAGQLHLVKKETERGIVTIQESMAHQYEKGAGDE